MQLRYPISDQKSEEKCSEKLENGGEIIIFFGAKVLPRPRLSSIFSFQITSFQLQPLQGVSEEDLQYLDEILANISSASSTNMSNHPSYADSSNHISGNL